jgi:glutamate decarboxylase
MPLHHATPSGPRGRGRPNPLHLLDDPTLGEDLVLPTERLSDRSLPAETAYQLVHDELMLDGNARLNLATFVTTFMEPAAARLMAECAEKNVIDKDEYPQTATLEQRCVSMLADLWHAPNPHAAIGCSTTGSSEACMLGGMALKRRWMKRTGAMERGSARPNLVMGANVQVCWEKFCNYWEVEPRLVPVTRQRTHLSAEEAARHCDENTIGVVAVLGSTYDGSYEPVAEIAAALDDLEQRSGLDIAIHVDGASGGMVAPFLDPHLTWDFRLPRVASINTSGHKYGLVYPGVGWILWRDHDALPEELVFSVDYLGGNMPTFALNFSRPGAQVAAQYYTFLRLGRPGFEAVHRSARAIATGLSHKIAGLGPFELITSGDELPVFAVTTRAEVSSFDVYDVSRRMRERGWLIPAYRFPPDAHDLSVLRIVIRNGFSEDLAGLLVDDLQRLLPELERQSGPLQSPADGSAFHH